MAWSSASRASLKAIRARSRAVSVSCACAVDTALLLARVCERSKSRSAWVSCTSARCTARSNGTGSSAAICTPSCRNCPSCASNITMRPPTSNDRSTVSSAAILPKKTRCTCDAAPPASINLTDLIGAGVPEGVRSSASCATRGVARVAHKRTEISCFISKAFRVLSGTYAQ